MKYLFALLVLFTSTAYSESPMGSFAGCYDTLERNGTPITKNPNQDFRTVIKYGDAIGWRDEATHQSIQALKFSIYEGHYSNPERDSFRIANAFLDRGHFTSTASTESFEFNGKLYSIYFGKVVEVVSRVIVTSLENDQIMLHVFLTTADLDGSALGASENHYLLQKRIAGCGS